MQPALIVSGLALLGAGLAAYYETSRPKTKSQQFATEAMGGATTFMAAGAGALAGAALGLVATRK